MWGRYLKRHGVWLRVGRLGFDIGCRRGRNFLHFFVSRLILGSIQHSVKWVPTVKTTDRWVNHLTSYKCCGSEYLDPWIHIPCEPSWLRGDTFTFLVLFLHFRRKTGLMKWASGCVCVKFCPPPNNFQTSYPIDTKFWLHIVSYRNSRTPLLPFLNFENCAREKLLKIIFSPFD